MKEYKWRIVADCTDRRIVLLEHETESEAFQDFEWITKDDSPRFLWVMNNPNDRINKDQIVQIWIESPEKQRIDFEAVQNIVRKHK